MRKANAGLLKMIPQLKKTYSFWCYVISIALSSSLLLLAQGTVSAKEKQQLFVFYDSSDVASSELLKHLVSELEQKVNSYQILPLNLHKSPLNELSSLTESSPDNCIITIGYDALKKIASTRNNIPIFSTQVPKHALDKTIQNYQRLGSKIGGIYQEQSFNRQLLLAKALDHEIKGALLLLNRQTRYQLEEYKNIALANSFKLKFNLLSAQASSPAYFLKDSATSDVLILINELVHHKIQDLQSFLITSYNKQVPIIGNKKTDSIHAAIASIYTPLDALTKEVSKQISGFCQTNESRVAQFSEGFQVEINQQIADHLNYKNINKQKLLMDIHLLEKQQQEMLNNG